MFALPFLEHFHDLEMMVTRMSQCGFVCVLYRRLEQCTFWVMNMIFSCVVHESSCVQM